MPKVPQNLEAEAAVLGSVLLDPTIFPHATATLDTTDFWAERHKDIFEAMQSLKSREEPIDNLTLEAELESRSLLQSCGGCEYLLQLLDGAYSPSNINHYAALVKRESQKRLIMDKTREVYKLIAHDPDGLEKVAAGNGQYALSDIARSTARTLRKSAWSRGFLSAADFPEEEDPQARIWFALYPATLTYICGETGAGKSSWLYNVMVHAARNEPLWNIQFGMGKPLKVLYIDPENAGNFDTGKVGLPNEKLIRIGAGRPRLLVYHDGQHVNLSDPDEMRGLIALLIKEKFDVLVLDPIISLFQTKDENDNAEAGAQFAALKALCKQSNCAVVAVHHTGKDGSGIFGRGATARLGAADVGAVLRVRGETDETDDDYGTGHYVPRSDIIRVQVVKNRMEPGKASLFLRMAGEDRFERVKFDDWKNAAKSHANGEVEKLYLAKESIQALLMDRVARSTAVIIEAMVKEGIGIGSTREALKELVEDKVLTSTREGRTHTYQLLLNDDDTKALVSSSLSRMGEGVPGWDYDVSEEES